MLTTIVLGGPLGKKFGRIYRMDLNAPSPGEAVRALSAVVKGFRAYLVENDKLGFHVFVGKQDIGAGDLRTPTSRQITIMPALVGGAKQDIFQIILGGVLIAAGAVLVATGIGAVVGVNLIVAGGGMVLGGVANLLLAPPGPEKPMEYRTVQQPSYAFDGAVNTVNIGHPVPICYGELEVGSQVISAGMATEWANIEAFSSEALVIPE